MSRRRHSSSRATTFARGLRQQASVGLRGPRGRLGDERETRGTNFNRADRVKDIISKHINEIRQGLTEQDIARINAGFNEADEAVLFADPDIASLEEQQIKRRLEKYYVPSLGELPMKKPDGFRRFMATQLNGTATPAIRKAKIEQCTQLINKYDVDVQSYVEHGLNMAHFKASQTFDSFFEAEVELRSVTGHNKNEDPGTPHQQGGTGLLATNEIIEYWKGSGTDPRNLGRWSWIRLGAGPHTTRVVSVYGVGKRKTEGWGRVYHQHLRHIQINNLDCSPYELFCRDLFQQLRQWTEQGERLIVMMDTNEHILNSAFGRKLVSEEAGLDLIEISHSAWGGREINTHIEGSEPIDGVWVSRSLETGGFKILSFVEGVGDHRTYIFDIESRSLLGADEHRVVRPGCRRLNTKTPSLGCYLQTMDRLMAEHKLETRLDKIIASIVDDKPTPGQKAAMETLDKQFSELQKCAEKQCRKILKPALEFSPQVQL